MLPENTESNVLVENQRLEAGSKDDTKDSTYDFDIILSHFGRLGRYQALLVAFAYYLSMPAGMHEIASVFLLAIPQHRCFIAGIDNNDVYANYSDEYLRNISTPETDEGQNGCEIYDYNYTSCSNGTFDCLDNATKPSIVPCESYVYSRAEFKETVVTEWNLVCDDLILGTTATSTFYAGEFIGCLFGGTISDYFGRRNVMFAADIGLAVSGILCAFSPSLLVFTITRFTVAIFVSTTYSTAFVYVMEITYGKWRSILGIMFQAGYAVGCILLSAMAYGWKNWRELQMAMSLVSLPFILMWIFMLESPRWLFANGRDKEGKEITRLIARRDGVPLPENIWEKASTNVQAQHSEKQHYTVLALFRKPRTRKVTFIVMICWFTVSLTYYGLSLNIGAFSGDVYVNNVLSGMVEIFACPIAIVIMERFGKKKSLNGLYLLAGSMCIAASVMTAYSTKISVLGTLGTALALCGKLAVSAVFAIVYNYTAELYPTVVRGTAMGFCATISGIATVITPYTLYLQNIVSWLPGVIYGALSLLAGLAIFELPETKNRRLMTTFDEAEKFFGGDKPQLSARYQTPTKI